MDPIPYGRQDIDDDDVRAVERVLRSDYLTQGPAVPAFEQAVAAYCGAAEAVAVNSATSALHIACLALGVGPGDVVWTSPITFVASANCALYCGARVDFVDIDPATGNMSVAALEARLERAAAASASGSTSGSASALTLPRVIIPVHLSGQPCDMAAIGALARRFGCAVIEDASHAIGARDGDEPVGRGRHSDITIFSFHPVKIITTAEGGMAVTNRRDLADRMRLLRSHGVTRDREQMTADDGPWYYEQVALGFNYRITDIQAALGSSQLRRLDEFVERRTEIARAYDTRLAGLPVAPLGRPAGSRSALHLYVVRLQLDRLRRSHREIFEAMRAAGVLVNLHYIPVYRQPYYAAMGFRPADFPEAERYYAEAISLPMYAALTPAQQDRVVGVLAEACAA